MLVIRPGTREDVPLLRTMIRELAEFERELEFCVIEEQDLERDGFGANPKFKALIAEWDGRSCGYAVYFGYYSTWIGSGLYLEDLFVRQEFRGKGIGMALLSYVAKTAVQQDGKFLRWEVLGWNENAIELYKSLGAEFRDEWKSVFLMGDVFQRLAGRSS